MAQKIFLKRKIFLYLELSENRNRLPRQVELDVFWSVVQEDTLVSVFGSVFTSQQFAPSLKRSKQTRYSVGLTCLAWQLSIDSSNQWAKLIYAPLMLKAAFELQVLGFTETTLRLSVQESLIAMTVTPWFGLTAIFDEVATFHTKHRVCNSGFLSFVFICPSLL